MKMIIGKLLSLIFRIPDKNKPGEVYLPKSIFFVGLIDFVVFLAVTVISALSNTSILLPILFSLFSLLGVILMIGFLNCRITFDENGFVCKNFFGIKKRYGYDQVTAIKNHMHDTVLYMGKHKVTIEALSVGGTEFIAHAKKRYRCIHNGQSIPKISKEKFDIFKGNIMDPAGFLFIYIFIWIVIVFFAGLLAKYIYFTPATVDNTICNQVVFKSCIKNDDEITLTSDDDQIYKIRFIKEMINEKEIISICENRTSVIVYSELVSPKNESEFYFVRAICDNDKYILSFDETNNFYTREYMPLLIIPAVFAVVWGVFVTCSIIIGRNPKRFGKKVVRLFFKEGYVRY